MPGDKERELSPYEQERLEKLQPIIEANKKDWRTLVHKDLLDTEYFPDSIEQPEEFMLKKCFYKSSIDVIEKEDVAYLVESNGEDLLVLFEIVRFLNLSSDERDQVYSALNACIDEVFKDDERPRYVGVGKSYSLYMQQSPTEMVKDSTANTSDLLKGYYQAFLDE